MSERVQAEKHLAEILFDSMPQQYGQSSAGQIGSHGSGHAGAAGAGEGAGMSVNDDLCEELDKAIMKAKELVAEKNQLIAALEKIERWDNFLPSGRFYPHGEEMSYGAAFGSNGERDYMRSVASAALAKVKP